jgi:hypothetical protein
MPMVILFLEANNNDIPIACMKSHSHFDLHVPPYTAFAGRFLTETSLPYLNQ